MSLHQLLGGGFAADIFLWKNKRNSAAALIIVTFIWFLFEVANYPFVSFVCIIFIISMLILVTWSNFGKPLNKRGPPSAEDISIPEFAFQYLFSRTSLLWLTFYEISCGKDMKLFLVTIFWLSVVAIVGSHFTLLTFLYIGFMFLATMPALYLKFQRGVDNFVGKILEGIKKLYREFDSKVVSKIPRASLREKTT